MHKDLHTTFISKITALIVSYKISFNEISDWILIENGFAKEFSSKVL